MRLLKLVGALLMVANVAHATTISITQGTGTSMLTKQDGSGNNASSVTVCDATTPTTCAPVDATKGLKVDLSAYFSAAGSANTNVLSVQGITSGTALTVTGAGGTFPISGATSNASSAVVTSSTNAPTVGYGYGFNGTTWDQLQVDGSKNLKVNLQSVPSGAVASGAYASGSLASGAGTDGWNVTEGTKTDAAWSSGSGSIVSILKTISGNTGGAIPAGSALIGKVGIDQTTPGTTNGVQTLTGSTTAVTQATAASLNATVVGTGTFAVQDSTTETNTGTIAGAVSASVMQSNTKQVNGVTTLAGAGAVGTGAQRVAVGQDATTVAGMAPGTVGAGTAPADMVVGGCIYNATNPAATDTQSVAIQCDTAGRLKVNAQPATQNAVSGTANTTGNSTTSLITAVASNRIYVSAFSCANTGASASLISFQDGSGGTTLWTTIVPAGGGSNVDGNTALFKTTSGNGVYFLPATASTTIYCSAAGYSAP